MATHRDTGAEQPGHSSPGRRAVAPTKAEWDTEFLQLVVDTTRGSTVQIPYGHYVLTGPIVVPPHIRLIEGNWSTVNARGASVMRFEPATRGA